MKTITINLFLSLFVATVAFAQQTSVTPVGSISIGKTEPPPPTDKTAPKIVINQSNNQTVHNKNFIISGYATDPSGVDEIKIKGDYRDFSEGSRFSFKVELKEGRNNFTIEAEDKLNNEAQKSFSVNYVLQRKDYALLFYNSKYKNMHNLDGTKTDAEKLAKTLKTEFGFETQIYGNKNATEVKKNLKQFAQKEYNPNDQLLIYFSGHGRIEKISDDNIKGFFMLAEETEISHNDFMDYSKGNCKHVLIVADASFSGKMNKLDPNSAISATNKNTSTADEYVEQVLKAESARKILTSGEDVSKAGMDDGLSDFTKAFIKTLKEVDSKHNVTTFYDLEKKLKSNYSNLKSGAFGDDNSSSNFIFRKK